MNAFSVTVSLVVFASVILIAFSKAKNNGKCLHLILACHEAHCMTRFWITAIFLPSRDNQGKPLGAKASENNCGGD
jgi:hypothetical protein